MAEPFTMSSGTAVLWNLDPVVFRVLKASRLLHATAKLVWMEDHLLSRKMPTSGSFMGAPRMADRLGISASSVEQIRRALLSFELMLKKKGNGRGDFWMPCLPAEAVPERQETNDAVFRELGDRLDLHLRHRAEKLPPSFFYCLDWLTATHGIQRPRPTASSGPDPQDTTGLGHGMPGVTRTPGRRLASQEGGLGGVPSQQVLKEPSLLSTPRGEGTSLTRGERRDEMSAGDRGPGEGEADPAVIDREMADLKRRLASNT